MYYIEKKKRANSRKYTPFLQFINVDEVVRYVKDKGLSFSFPYFFTCIELSDGTIITQKVQCAGREIPTSPETLRKLLTTK